MARRGVSVPSSSPRRGGSAGARRGDAHPPQLVVALGVAHTPISMADCDDASESFSSSSVSGSGLRGD